MEAKYIQRGETLDYKNEGTQNITLGQVVVEEDKAFIAADNIPIGAIGAVAAAGVFEMNKAAGEAIAMGKTVYYDSANDCVTATGTNNTKIGFAVSPAAAAADTVAVKIG